jgi:citrate synthase
MLINVDHVVDRRQDGAMPTTANVPVPASSPDTAALIEVPPGLKGVAVTDTAIGDVRGSEGFYHYRQYSAVDLARAASFEEVAELVVDGRLPDVGDTRFADELASLRALPADLTDSLTAVAAATVGTNPLDGLRSALSLLAASKGMRPVLDLDPTARRADAVALIAATPTLVTALYRLGRGERPIAPRPDLGTAANILWMVNGIEAEPIQVRSLERYLIATIDHGFNASTFTARVIASTGADVGSCVVGAVGALSGPLHGGAPSRALDLIEEVGTADRIDAVVLPKIESGERIMGFGHAVYRGPDPRSALLRETAEELGGERVKLAEQVEDRVVELLAEHKPGHQLASNVEFYAGVVMESCGLPPSLFTPMFACSRVVGWGAHVLEQAGERAILRPSARYVGPPAPTPLPEERRSA